MEFLKAQAEAFLPVEKAIEKARPERLIADWPKRRRAALLEADLIELGMVRTEGAEFPTPISPEALLGVIYVLEGSRLGGTILSRQIPDRFPQRFLTASDPSLWRSLIDKLDKLLKTEAQIAMAASAAKEVFARFEEGALRHKRGVRSD